MIPFAFDIPTFVPYIHISQEGLKINRLVSFLEIVGWTSYAPVEQSQTWALSVLWKPHISLMLPQKSWVMVSWVFPLSTYLDDSSLKWLGIIRVCQVRSPADQIRFVLWQIIRDFVGQIERILHDLRARSFHISYDIMPGRGKCDLATTRRKQEQMKEIARSAIIRLESQECLA